MLGTTVSTARYGRATTRRRALWNGVGFASLLVPGLCLSVWFMCPFCQLPNRNGLQLVSAEQRFKNYLD